jgi:DNA-binding XRE family transcriptional regulator
MSKPIKKRGIRKDEKFLKFQELYESGEKFTQKELCEIVGISRDTLNRWVKELGLDKPKGIDYEKLEIALQKFSAKTHGLTLEEYQNKIANESEINKAFLRNYFKIK